MFQPRVMLTFVEVPKSKEEISTPEERAILLQRQKYLNPKVCFPHNVNFLSSYRITYNLKYILMVMNFSILLY